MSIDAIHSPEDATTTRSTFEGSIGLSSRRETLLEGETSSSDISLDEEGEYVWSDEGCDEGRMRVDVGVWTAKGADTEVDGHMCGVAGSTSHSQNHKSIEYN
jgi:hypothetical protein